jgi:hypothetical protein
LTLLLPVVVTIVDSLGIFFDAEMDVGDLFETIEDALTKSHDSGKESSKRSKSSSVDVQSGLRVVASIAMTRES